MAIFTDYENKHFSYIAINSGCYSLEKLELLIYAMSLVTKEVS